MGGGGSLLSRCVVSLPGTIFYKLGPYEGALNEIHDIERRLVSNKKKAMPQMLYRVSFGPLFVTVDAFQ